MTTSTAYVPEKMSLRCLDARHENVFEKSHTIGTNLSPHSSSKNATRDLVDPDFTCKFNKKKNIMYISMFCGDDPFTMI